MHYGLRWVGQSCWIDSTLMALFFPMGTYSFFYPYILRAGESKEKTLLLRIISNLREPEKESDIGELRSVLKNRSNTKDQRLAFQEKNKYGYVFYFLQEFLKMFSVPPLAAVGHRDRYILEIQDCSGSIVECLETTFEGWTWNFDSLRYLIIELVK